MSELNPVTEPEVNENEETEEEPTTDETETETVETKEYGKFDEAKLVKTEMVDENGYWKTVWVTAASEEETEEEPGQDNG